MILFSGGRPEIDLLYIGETIDQLILKLGEPSEYSLKVIDNNYLGYESEPDYSRHFSFEELQETVTIKILTWNNKNIRTVVWAKNILNEWIIFSSLRWNRRHTTF